MNHEDATKQCPECAETIKAAAIKCRYCGYRFDSETERLQTEPMAEEEFVRLRGKVDNGECLATTENNAVWDEWQRARTEILALGTTIPRAALLRAQEADWDPAGEAESDPALRQKMARVAELRRQSLRAGHLWGDNLPLQTIEIQRQMNGAAMQWAQARSAVDDANRRSHAGLFAVSPLAWGIRKTWNGKPKPR